MANTMLGALSGVRPVNWGMLIHEVVSRNIPYIGRRPSYLFPFLLDLYEHYECATIEERDLLTIAKDEVTYKLQPVAADSTSSDHVILEAPPSSAGSLPSNYRLPNSSPPPSPHHHRHHPRAAGHMLMNPGGTWIYPLGTFRKTPYNGCTMTWRTSRPSITGWSTSPG